MSNDILSILSSIGKIRIEKFKDIYDTLLKLESDKEEEDKTLYSYWDILNDLEALGHCEVDYENKYIYVCPPSFTLLPNRGTPQIILAGGRDLQLIKRLQNLADKNAEKIKVTLFNHPSKNLIFPLGILIEAKSKRILEQVTKRIRVEGNMNVPSCWSLLNQNPNIRDLIDSLSYKIESEPNWKNSTFCYNRLHFKSFDCIDKVKLVNYINPYSQQQQTWIWNGTQSSIIDRNWGRYAILHHYKTSVIMFDLLNQRLAVPSSVPLPIQLAKVLTLCSGYLPRTKLLYKSNGPLKEKTMITVYERIPEAIAIEISKKLGQTLLGSSL
ncbi:hypothetical protein LAV77_25190 [Priestia megaterium]|uniref:hypothetical protein n=1 Tax=Priestia megaterium TaxID=1404 RepID=UPI002B252268|nr:hypothetical protein [Priestia megaterium]MEB2268110.1 hypothetical protein [Priestia megaterium]